MRYIGAAYSGIINLQSRKAAPVSTGCKQEKENHYGKETTWRGQNGYPENHAHNRLSGRLRRSVCAECYDRPCVGCAVLLHRESRCSGGHSGQCIVGGKNRGRVHRPYHGQNHGQRQKPQGQVPPVVPAHGDPGVCRHCGTVHRTQGPDRLCTGRLPVPV